MNYLNITYEQLLLDFRNRLESDPRFKNIGSSTIYGMFQEMLLACMDMTNYYIQRTAEEAYIDTARLDSSIIKLAKNLGYNPRRPIPAICELIIQLHGPLPSELKAGTVIVFNQDMTDLSFNGNKFILDASYTYTFTEEDILNGSSSDWTKNLRFSVPSSDTRYIPLAGVNYYNTNNTSEIKAFQAERKTVEINGETNYSKVGKPGQFYDIDDVTFSNWYSKRDPFAYYRGNYIQGKSWTQVAIGPSEAEAFKDDEDNLFDIEDQNIFLNEKLAKLTAAPSIPLKICQMETNSDKTVRLSFTPETTLCNMGLNDKVKTQGKNKLYTKNQRKVQLPNASDQGTSETFVNYGLSTDRENIYVRYLSTNGKAANQTGTKAANMTFTNKFYVSSYGNILDLTNNVAFVINSDIYGGDDFESQKSIKINAPAYFSSRLKLITKDDYTSYFRSLTSPLNVQNALVYGEQELTDMYNNRHDLFMNNIIYCLFGHLYIKNSGDWYMKNVLTDTNDQNDPVTIYGDEYKYHICDYITSIFAYEAFLKKLNEANPDEQWVKNIQLVAKNAKPKMEINSVLLSVPPIIQYFDLVGTVKIKKSADPQTYQTEMKNKVYEYLDGLANKQREIYKSDIIGLYYEHEDTISVDLDIKVSSIIKSDTFLYKWSQYGVGQDYEFIDNHSLDSYTWTYEKLCDSNAGRYALEYTQKGAFNQIKLPKTDNYAKTATAAMFNNKRIMIKFTTQHCYDGKTLTEQEHSMIVRCEAFEDDEAVYLALPTEQIRGNALYTDESDVINKTIGHPDGVSYIEVYIPTTDDYFSTSNFGLAESDTYRLSGSDITSIESDLNSWLNNLLTSTTANRTIPLPYTVYTNTTVTREESITRYGNYTDTNYKRNLNEASFWRYFVKDIILGKYYSGNKGKNIIRPTINESTDYNSDEWKAARALIMDIYPLVKAGLCDTILDDNNNIVNFSTPMEIAALNNMVDIVSET